MAQLLRLHYSAIGHRTATHFGMLFLCVSFNMNMCKAVRRMSTWVLGGVKDGDKKKISQAYLELHTQKSLGLDSQTCSMRH